MKRRPDGVWLLASLAAVWLASAVLRYVPGASDLAGRVESVFTPLQNRLSQGAGNLRQLAEPRREAAELRAEIERLSTDLDRLQVENQQLDDLIRENRELREQLGFRRLRADLDLEGASIVGRSVASEPGPILRAIKLDIGGRDGVGDRMTVVSHRGLVGQVVRLDDNWCDVMLITHPKSRIRSRIDRTHATGMVFGLPSGELIMKHIPQNRDAVAPNVQVGDIVETSGLSDRFPGQITIGQVVSVRQNDVDKWQEAQIRPSVDFDALELVMVVTAWKPSADSLESPAGADDSGGIDGLGSDAAGEESEPGAAAP